MYFIPLGEAGKSKASQDSPLLTLGGEEQGGQQGHLHLEATRKLTLVDVFRHKRLLFNFLVTFLAWQVLLCLYRMELMTTMVVMVMMVMMVIMMAVVVNNVEDDACDDREHQPFFQSTLC